MRHRFDRPHTGKVEMPTSNQRWCSDGFNIRCWNGEVVRVAFALDCHDREALGHVARARDLRGEDIRLLLDEVLWSRFGERTLTAPTESLPTLPSECSPQMSFVPSTLRLYVSRKLGGRAFSAVSAPHPRLTRKSF